MIIEIKITIYSHGYLNWLCITHVKLLKHILGILGLTYESVFLHLLDLNEEGKSIDQKVYRSMIGSLLYLCASRPDIMLNVCMCARFQANPKECHLVAIERILRYLVHTPNLVLWYPKGSTFDLLGYSDSDYDGCKVDRKCTTGMCQFLGRFLVSWSSKK